MALGIRLLRVALLCHCCWFIMPMICRAESVRSSITPLAAEFVGIRRYLRTRRAGGAHAGEAGGTGRRVGKVAVSNNCEFGTSDCPRHNCAAADSVTGSTAMGREDDEVGLLTAEDAEIIPTHQLVFGDHLYLGEFVRRCLADCAAVHSFVLSNLKSPCPFNSCYLPQRV